MTSTCEVCALFARPSCERELRRAEASGRPFLGRFVLAARGYRDGAWRARDLATGRAVVIARHGPGQRTRCGAFVVARDRAATHSRSVADGADIDARLRELVAAGAIADAVALMQERWSGDLERVVRARRRAWVKPGVDDICQMVWMSVHAGLPAFRFEAPARAWLFRIAERKIIDLARRGPGDEPLDTDGIAAIAASLTGPLSRLLRDERAAAVQAELERLDRDDALLLQLRFAFDMSMREIAYFLADDGEPPVAENTLAQRIGRLLARLGKQLKRSELFRSKLT